MVHHTYKIMSNNIIIKFKIILFYLKGEEGDDIEFEAPKIYEPIESFQQLEEKLKMYQDQYNETIRGSKMDLVFFQVRKKNLCKRVLLSKVKLNKKLYMNKSSSLVFRFHVKTRFKYFRHVFKLILLCSFSGLRICHSNK